MNNGMDDNVPDVCKRCGYIISPEEDAPDDICEKCRLKSLYDAKCAEAEKMRGACRRAYFALMDWDAPIQDSRIPIHLREMYETCSLAEAGKPLLDKIVALEQENTKLQQAAKSAYEHLDRYGAALGDADEIASQEKVFDLLRPYKQFP